MTALAVLAVACSGSDSSGVPRGDEDQDADLYDPNLDDSGLTCLGDPDCPDGFYCENQICREKDCEEDIDCPPGYRCEQFLCLKAEDGDEESLPSDGDEEADEPEYEEEEEEAEPDLPVICEAGDVQCQGGELATCNESGTEWIDFEACPEGQVCLVDACVPSTCPPDQWGECVNDFTIYRCNSLGTGWEETPCPPHTYCEPGQCVDIVCEPGAELGCVDPSTVKKCVEEGNDWITEPCPEGAVCQGDGCAVIICSAGEWKCEDTILYYCNAVGTGWDEILDCAESGGVCAEGSCQVRICEPGLRACDEANPKLAEQCNELGTAWLEVETCEGTDECRGGECLGQCEIAAFDRSYVGCDYWPVDLHNGGRSSGGEFALVVTNPQSYAVGVSVSGKNGVLQTKTIGAGSLDVFTFDSTRLIGGPGISPNAYHLHAEAPVTVTQMNPYGNVLIYSNDASLLLPEGALDTDYVGLSWPSHRVEDCYCNGVLLFGACLGSWECDVISGDSSYGFLTVAATQPGTTTVTVRYKGASRAGGGVNAESAGAERTYTLSQFDVLNLEAAGTDCPDRDEETFLYCSGADLTGTTIVANQKVAVYGGHECTFIPQDQWACDHLEHQLFPTGSWGKAFTAVRTEPRYQEKDYYKILADEAGTIVTLSPDPTGQSPKTLGAGEFWLFATDRDFSITATKPIMVGQFLAGQDATGLSIDDEAGDPAMMLLAPNEQFRKDYIFLVPPNYVYDHITIVAPPDATVTLDGVTNYDSNTFPAVTADFRRLRLALADGAHKITATKPVGLYVYGYSRYVSYAYTAGLDLKEINPKP
ncbi:MAG: hypothetical protein C4523_01525 [Myxococcales bacterium]|nr:MAG: hypothetical protein C4523_01525 [Myxococcales bacterium]